MSVTGREAAAILSGVGLARAQTRQVLRCGLAGAATVTNRATFYDEGRVRALAARPVVSTEVIHRICPVGLYVARQARDSDYDARAGWREQRRHHAVQPPMPWFARAMLAVEVRALGSLGFVATVAGFVTFGADLADISVSPDDRLVLHLEPPGEWFEVLRQGRVQTGRGGRPWAVLRPPWDQERLLRQ